MGDVLRQRLSGDSRRIIWAVADQCAVSGGNFLTNLILVRTLLPEQFGTYALVLNAILFFNNVQQAFVAYPLCVRGARAKDGQFRRILAFSLFVTTALVLVVLGPALAGVGAFLHLSTVIFAALLAMLFWQLQDTIRSGFIAKLEQRRALAGDAIGYIGQAVLLGLVCIHAKPSLNFIFWTIAGTSLAAFGLQSWQVRPSIPRWRAVPFLAHEFWSLGRWNVIAKLLGFLTLQAFPWLILMRHGRVEVAGFQAVFQFLAFTNPLLFSISNLITATVAKRGDYRTTSVRNYAVLTSVVVGGYLLVLGVWGAFAMRFLYGSHSLYLGYASLMPIFAAAWLFEVIAILTSAILGGLREPRSLFLLQLSGAIAAVLIVLPWIYFKGIVAAAFGMLFVNAVRAGAGVFLVLRRRGSSTEDRRRSEDFDESILGAGSVESLTESALPSMVAGVGREETYVEP
jgi:O-antigen/teichoic acid export membrane protein